MRLESLVSVIIPTFNRAHLISETLNSLLAQTYTNWECIVVDDGSIDDTETLIRNYISSDSRFQYHKRSDEYLPGGSGARNYGFKLSKGDFIQWFDSDDLMHENNLEIKMKTILDYKADFVISQTRYFNKVEKKPYTYNYKEDDVNFLSYATTHINWFTPDMFLKRYVVENITFNEELKSGQEFNFSCKLLLVTENLKKIDKVLTFRRYSNNSIGSKRRDSKNHFLYTRFQAYWLNYLELSKLVKNEKFERFSLLMCMSCYLRSGSQIQQPNGFRQNIFKVFGYKGVYFYLADLSKLLFGNYYFFYKKLK
ncbi:glycosyltransferase family 2 protein [Psychroserpens sp. Hel_I_66]|uniref:glycosyltransferase family 2 protein n=1 Tax=Psychroserpens sp. Hel_I_66 TaxID=1250004 RepID=UPI0006475122|nr:glycosyltransferase family 2 protein [Psychroserpens sp. Hel_I_66]